ncbi:MAG: hypothetical protein R2827_15360 [Bdellovibrionales bacterium]
MARRIRFEAQYEEDMSQARFFMFLDFGSLDGSLSEESRSTGGK